jgi:hypothetical protein
MEITSRAPRNRAQFLHVQNLHLALDSHPQICLTGLNAQIQGTCVRLMPVFRTDRHRMVRATGIGGILALMNVVHRRDTVRITKRQPTTVLHIHYLRIDVRIVWSPVANEETDLVVRSVTVVQDIHRKIDAINRHLARTELWPWTRKDLAAPDYHLILLATGQSRKGPTKNGTRGRTRWRLPELPSQSMQTSSMSILQERL